MRIGNYALGTGGWNEHPNNLGVNAFGSYDLFSLKVNVRKSEGTLQLGKHASESVLAYQTNLVDFLLFLKMSHYIFLCDVLAVVFHYDGRICLTHCMQGINYIVVKH